MNGDATPARKTFLSETKKGVTPTTIWPFDEVGHNHEASTELKSLDLVGVFDNPKPTRLIRRMIELSTNSDDDQVILDFFAGSGTTGDATLRKNADDNGNRKFILVQLPEPTGREGYQTIADITKERARRVIRDVNEKDAAANDLSEGKHDRGFRVFKLAESSFDAWNAEAAKDEAQLTQQLELHVQHIREGRTNDDLLFEILLKRGFALTTPVETLELAGKTVQNVAEGKLMVCLERELTLELIRAMAATKPETVVCLDAGFAGNDQLKANAVQIFRTQGVTTFRTV